MKIEVTAHIHLHNSDGALLRLLQTIAVKLDLITKRQIMGNATLDQALDAITKETTLVGGVTTLVTGLKQQLADALAGATLSPAVQAKVQAIFDGATANKRGARRCTRRQHRQRTGRRRQHRRNGRHRQHGPRAVNPATTSPGPPGLSSS